MAPKKDHCPFCQTEADLGNTRLAAEGLGTLEAECFVCPSCNGEFMTIPQVEQVLRAVRDRLAADA